MAEKDFQNRLLKKLKERYTDSFIYKCSDRFTSGIPDILMCINGLLVALELKWAYGRPTKLQLYKLRQIQQSGGYASVLRQKDKTYTIEHDNVLFDTFPREFNSIDTLLKGIEDRICFLQSPRPFYWEWDSDTQSITRIEGSVD